MKKPASSSLINDKPLLYMYYTENNIISNIKGNIAKYKKKYNYIFIKYLCTYMCE